MTTFWMPAVLDQLVAPGVAQLRRADIPSLEADFPDAPHWLANHFLNTALGPGFRAPARQRVIGYLRRTHHAFRAFHEARAKTHDFLMDLGPSKPAVRKYYEAVALWEAYALQSQMAITLYNALGGTPPAFERKDGSAEQRLYDIANAVKHAGDFQVSDSQPPLPLWLTDDGLRSYDHGLTYLEAAAVLKAMATLADALQKPSSLQRPDNAVDPDPSA